MIFRLRTFKSAAAFLLVVFLNSTTIAVSNVDHEERLKHLGEVGKTIEQNLKELRPSKHKIIDAMFLAAPMPARAPSIITDHEWQELECDELIKKLDRSQTSFGFWGLKRLTYPISDRETLIANQQKIRTIVNDDQLHKELKQLLDKIKTAENDLLSYWDANEELQVLAQGLYYSLLPPYTDSFDKMLNHNRLVLEGTTAYQGARRLAAFATNLCATNVILEAGNALVFKTDFDLKRAIKSGLTRPLTFNNPFPVVYIDGYDAQSNEKFARMLTEGNIGDTFQALKGKGLPPSLAFALSAVMLGSYNVATAIEIRDDWRNLVYVARTTNLLRDRMVRIATMFKAISELHAFMKQNAGLFDPQLMSMIDLKMQTQNVRELVTLLSQPTFTQSKSHLYSRGRVLLAHQLLHDYKNELMPILEGVAIVDGYCSIASLFTECFNTQAQFSFAQFTDEQKPHIAFEDFWTPLMPFEQAVLNSVEWGGQNKKNKIILTGPNGSGKSTIMKAAAHAIILAQSWGIVPSSCACMSVFTGLRTSFAPKESLQNNLSTFMAEKLRMDEIKEFITQHSAHDKYFVLLDEPYRGTVASEAEQRITLFGKNIAADEHCMLMMATHLEKPITLEAETGVFANYQLGLEEQNAHFIRTFKLIPGPALWWFHDVDRRMRFIDQLLVPQNKN